MSATNKISGRAAPLGATLVPGGANFSVYSREAWRIELLLFDGEDDARPSRTVPLDAPAHRSYNYWHAFVPGVGPGQLYAYRAHGPWDPANGLRFDSTKVLLDPYGRGVVVPERYSRHAMGAPSAMKSVVADVSTYDWEGDAPLRHPSAHTIIYEMHVKGFTRHASSGVAEGRRGTYAGVIEKIPYLKALGITAVELMPVFQFDSTDAPVGKTNYWGYAPVSFFAPHRDYSSRKDRLGALDEFRDLVKALHRAGIEVILDVVFNHTAEGDEHGPTLSLRGLDNTTYYLLEHDRARYRNYSGTGNTLNADHTVVRRMIVDSLRYWVEVMHVDGFRFDLASVLSRDSSGQPIPNPPVLWDIETEPALAGTKLIAEAWDAAGLYQVGSFVGDSWMEWNGRFRDDVRSFLRGDEGFVGAFVDRLIGSPSIYHHKQREPEQSVNFVTAHDGFTSNDLVSYSRKRNEANGEGNRDGADDNRSWNCGVEGPTDDPEIDRLRTRQVKNLLALTVLSAGTPMILMGDEVRRTQGGNNNAFCQDNETSWFDWTLLDRHADVHRFVTLLNTSRLSREAGREDDPSTLNELLRQADVTWHGVELNQPDWSKSSHAIACTARFPRAPVRVHLIVNAYWEPLDFELPPALGADPWLRCIDTSLESPGDIVELERAPAIADAAYRAAARSVVVLVQPLA